MELPKDLVIIDKKTGNVFGKEEPDEIYLLGKNVEDYSNYRENLWVAVVSKDGENYLYTKAADGGYLLQLFIGDFTGDGLDEIMVRGGFGGSGNYGIARIYTVKDNQLVEIFNEEIFSLMNQCKAEYLADYKISVSCPRQKKNYVVAIPSRGSEYWNLVYDSNGNVKEGVNPTVSFLNDAFPIQLIFQKKYSLLILQRIIGIDNADTLGLVQTWGNFNPYNFKIFNQGVFVST